MPKLTEKQKRFCEEYLIDLNATQAAIRAGYKEKTAYAQGQRLLKKVEAQEYLQELMNERSKRTEITADRVLRELAAIAFSDRTELAQVGERGEVNLTPTEKLPDEVKKIIAGIEEGKYGTKVTTYDKVKALELLGKHLGLFTAGADNSAALDKLDEVLGKIEGKI
ncbi:MAG: terminase small subunit [Ruminococcus sp.]|nr:terminase small subunit [Ruminococcus sp.]